MGKKYDALVAHLREVHNIRMASAVLGWDQQTQMPAAGSGARARQMATLSRVGHELFTGEHTAELLEAAESEVGSSGYDSDEASLLRVIKEDYAEATRLPSSFVAHMTEQTTLAHEVWVKARLEKDFSIFQPNLERIVDLKLQEAEYLGYEEHPYDALVNQYERGITTAQIDRIFSEHRPALVELIAALGEVADRVDDAPLHQNFPIEQQREFALRMVSAFGFDFERGVQAVAVHPFCTHFSTNDVRITTRFYDDFLNPALFGMMHEAGHGMYEQGVGKHLEGTPLAQGTSLGVHESQSRMWENLVGRSRQFWAWALPQLRASFPGQFDGISLDAFYKAINKVEKSFIRVEADEATWKRSCWKAS